MFVVESGTDCMLMRVFWQKLGYALILLPMLVVPAFAQAPDDELLRRKAALIAFHLEVSPDVTVASRAALALRQLKNEMASTGVAAMILMDPLPLGGWLDRLTGLQQVRLTPASSWPGGFASDALTLFMTSKFGHLDGRIAQDSLNDELFQMLFASNVRGLGSVALQHLEAEAIAQAPRYWLEVLVGLDDVPDFRAEMLAPLTEQLPLDITADIKDWIALEDSPGAGEPLPDSDVFGLDQTVDVLSNLAQELASGQLEAADARRIVAAARMRLFEANTEPFPEAQSVLGLATAVRGLLEGRYVDYLASVQAFGIEVGEQWRLDDDAVRGELVRLADVLRRLATTVEPMLQIADLSLAQLHAQSLEVIGALLQNGPTGDVRLRQSTLQAELQLVSVDLERYLEQPFRSPINAELDICFSQLEPEQDVFPPLPITQEQFMGCARSLADWATETSAEAEFAGEADGPFEPEHLARQLELDNWQRVNYWHAYTSSLYELECTESDQSLVNPLEWALAARALVMFADRWPAYSAQPDFRIALAEVAGVGEALADALRRQIRCPESVLSPIAEALSLYEDQLARVNSAARNVALEFRQTNLREGADIDLSGTSSQETNYRPPELMVEPCRQEGSCGMSDRIEVSRALLGLFPASYLSADQVGLGNLTLCYDNIQWVERRSELPRPAEKRMARFLGKLAFELYGKFDEEIIFARRLTSQTEYEYLFGENSPEVLNNACPRDLIGTKVESELPSRGLNLVPRRLSYMTADRTHPSRVFAENWEQGEEWKDWFVTGRGVEALFDSDGSAVETLVEAELRQLKRQLDQSLVTSMLSDPGDFEGAAADLAAAVNQLDLVKHQLQALTSILAANSVVYEDRFRAILRGDLGLLDRGRVLSLNVDGLAPAQTLEWAGQVLADARTIWQRQADLASANPGAEIPLVLARTLIELYALENRYTDEAAAP